MTITASDITNRGNAVAFTADSKQITVAPNRVRYCPTRWSVTVDSGIVTLTNMDSRCKTFDTKAEAAAYASSIADAAKTEELAWW